MPIELVRGDDGHFQGDCVNITLLEAGADVVSVNLPAGNYLLFAGVQFQNLGFTGDNSALVTCVLNPTGRAATVALRDENGTDHGQLTVTAPSGSGTCLHCRNTYSWDLQRARPAATVTTVRAS